MFFGNHRGRGGGRNNGGGMGLGFRGSSPPWPYTGRGRGGLPRCGYYYGAAAPFSPVFQRQLFSPGTPQAPFASRMTKEDELNYMKEQAEAIKAQLEEIESRMRDLSAQK